MAIHPRRKSDAARRANQIVRSRTVLVMLLLGIVTFAALFWRLYNLQIRQHAELQEKAISQQTRSAVVSASRGTIYDRNLNTLAISATAETVLISPLDIEKSVESQKEEQAKAAQKAADKGQDYTPPVLRDQSYIARGLSRILGLEQGAIEERMEKTNSQYEILKKKTDQTISDEVRRFINGEIDPEGNEVPEKQRVKLRGIWLQPDSKRYYLYSSLASGVIGFVNGDGIGSVGLEAKYDFYLRKAIMATVGPELHEVTSEQVGILKLMKLAVETDRFMQQLKKEGREQYSIGEYVEKVYNPVMNL